MKIKPTKIIGLQIADFDNLVNQDLVTPQASVDPGSCIPG